MYAGAALKILYDIVCPQEEGSPAATAWWHLSTLNVTPPRKLKGDVLATPLTKK